MALESMQIVVWGTCDLGKPRTRILLRGIKSTDSDIIECRADVWQGVADKSQVHGFGHRVRLLARWLGSYPGLLLRYLRLPKHDCVVIGYLGHLDVLALWPLAKLRGTPVVWDAFLSLYSTVVEDRQLVGRSHLLAYFLFAWEWLACRAADLILLDTEAHGDYFVQRYGIRKQKVAAVFIGVEPEVFPRPTVVSPRTDAGEPFTVVFFGQFIALHGLETIYEAARLSRGLPVRWILIGQGQEEAKLEARLKEDPLPHLKRIPLLPYPELLKWIDRADVCLGIFGDTDKASRVIPNKVFQILRVGKPLITRDSPAIRELLNDQMAGVCLVPPADPKALFEAVERMQSRRDELRRQVLHAEVAEQIVPDAIGRSMLRQMERLVLQH